MDTDERRNLLMNAEFIRRIVAAEMFIIELNELKTAQENKLKKCNGILKTFSICISNRYTNKTCENLKIKAEKCNKLIRDSESLKSHQR